MYANIGGPIGGAYIWTPATQTYQHGRPTHPGQWLLGLSSINYYCLVSIQPVFVLPGVGIMMLGTSE